MYTKFIFEKKGFIDVFTEEIKFFSKKMLHEGKIRILEVFKKPYESIKKFSKLMNLD